MWAITGLTWQLGNAPKVYFVGTKAECDIMLLDYQDRYLTKNLEAVIEVAQKTVAALADWVPCTWAGADYAVFVGDDERYYDTLEEIEADMLPYITGQYIADYIERIMLNFKIVEVSPPRLQDG